jgi:prepilin-type N-terminal cleavage/methylation domain-containing protein/prepilin-type processing-associated H-X9-DG protein
MPTRSSSHRAGAFTLIELLVVVSIIALLIGILLPSLGSARLSAKVTACQANSRSMAQANLSYAPDHDGYLPPDKRTNAKDIPPYTNDWGVRNAPQTPEDADKTWFAQLIKGDYVTDDPAAFDCPVIDNHRKYPQEVYGGAKRTWNIDYALNRYAIFQRPETAEDTSRCPLVMEPDMPLAAVAQFEHTIAAANWYAGGTRDDLEQLKAGSLSFAFVDGHVTRVKVNRDTPYAATKPLSEAYPEIFLPKLWSKMTSSGTRFVWRNVTNKDMYYIQAGPASQSGN